MRFLTHPAALAMMVAIEMADFVSTMMRPCLRGYRNKGASSDGNGEYSHDSFSKFHYLPLDSMKVVLAMRFARHRFQQSASPTHIAR
jgi:hypothetical protein